MRAMEKRKNKKKKRFMEESYDKSFSENDEVPNEKNEE
jgi:hypothetical protein